MKKADLVAKIAAEQKLDPKVLERMTVVELQKMDVVVPDDGDLLGAEPIGAPATGPTGTSPTDAPAERELEDHEIENDVSDSGTTDEPAKNPTLVGYNPVTGKEIYL